MAMVFCRSCAKELHDSAATCVQCGAPQATAASHGAAPAVPDGVRGWSWGAFLFNWIWAIGNRTWIGLLALVPYLGFGVAIWLGIQGREMAWKNGTWDSLEHFNRVQKAWSQWAVGFFVAGIAIVMALIGLGIMATARPSGTDATAELHGKAAAQQVAQTTAPAARSTALTL